MNISNGVKILSLDYLPNDEGQNNFLLKENFYNFNNDNVINGVNMDNLNYVDYENDNYEVNNNLDI